MTLRLITAARTVTAAPVSPDDPWPVPLAAPGEWFLPPAHMADAAERGVPTKTVFGPTGRTFGHVASFDIPITLPDGTKWYLPKDLDLNRTMQGHHVTAEGGVVNVGLIMTDRSHTDRTLPLDIARDKFGHVGNQLAQVAFGYDKVGVWHAGVVTPGTPAKSVIAARAGSVSGEWFPILAADGSWTGDFEFLGTQIVNVPGFPLDQEEDRSRYALAAARHAPLAIAARRTVIANMLPDRYPVNMTAKAVAASSIPAGATVTLPDGSTFVVEAAIPVPAAPVEASIEDRVAAAVEAAFKKFVKKGDDPEDTPADMKADPADTEDDKKTKKAKTAAVGDMPDNPPDPNAADDASMPPWAAGLADGLATVITMLQQDAMADQVEPATASLLAEADALLV